MIMESMDYSKFRIYEMIRVSGLTNMNDIDTVSELSKWKLSIDDVSTIIWNYAELKSKFENQLKSDHFYKAFLKTL